MEKEILVYYPDCVKGNQSPSANQFLPSSRLLFQESVVAVADGECEELRRIVGERQYVTSPLGPHNSACLLSVEGMTCNSCVKLIESTVTKQCHGVKGIRVSLERNEAFIEFASTTTSPTEVSTAIFDMGFEAKILETYPSSPSASPVMIFSPTVEASKLITISVIGMVCNSCVQNIESNVSKLEGVLEVKVSLMENSAYVRYDQSKITPTALCCAIEDVGFEALCTAEKSQASPTDEQVCHIGIEGMTSRVCVSDIETAVGELEGVLSVHVSLNNKEGTVTYDQNLTTSRKITKAINVVGFEVIYVTEDTKEVEYQDNEKMKVSSLEKLPSHSSSGNESREQMVVTSIIHVLRICIFVLVHIQSNCLTVHF